MQLSLSTCLGKKKLAFKVLSLYAVAGQRRPTLVHVNFILV